MSAIVRDSCYIENKLNRISKVIRWLHAQSASPANSSDGKWPAFRPSDVLSLPYKDVEVMAVDSRLSGTEVDLSPTFLTVYIRVTTSPGI